MSQQGCRFLRSTLQTCLCPRRLTLNTWLPRQEATRAQISRRLSAKPVWFLSVAISKRRMSQERISGTRLKGSNPRSLRTWRTGTRDSVSGSRKKELRSRLLRRRGDPGGLAKCTLEQYLESKANV